MDKFAAIREAGIHGLNYDLDTPDIIRQLEAWDARLGLSVVKVERDAFTVRLESLPPDVDAFAEEVAEFCPDIIFQGVGSPAALAEIIREERTVFFWWD